MIQIDRGPEPDGFAGHSNEWWNEFQQAKAQNPKLSAGVFWSRVRRRRAMQNYAQMLYKAFYGKCAFCESRMKHVSPAHIEHYRPKSKKVFQSRMFKWDNWLLSCPMCNTNKSTKFYNCDGQPCLIDPTAEDPGEHLDFIKAQILHKTDRGQKTIKQIKLYRPDLTKERTQWLISINYLLLLVLFVPEVKNEARELLIWTMQPDAPYAAMARSYLRQKTPKLANPETPHPTIEPNNQFKHIADLMKQYSKQLQQLM